MTVLWAVFFVAGLLQVVADHIVEYSFAENLQVLAGEDELFGFFHLRNLSAFHKGISLETANDEEVCFLRDVVFAMPADIADDLGSVFTQKTL